MALRIQLRDGEKVIVNGAVLRSSGRTKLFVENQVTTLRGTDIMLPEEAVSPARRLYFTCMMAYLEPEQDIHRENLAGLFADTLNTFDGPEAKFLLGELATFMATLNFYRALGVCRELIIYEDGVLEHVGRDAEYRPDPRHAA